MTDLSDVGSPYGETDESLAVTVDGETMRVQRGVFAGVDISVHIGASYYKDYNFEIRDDGDTLAYVGATANHGGAPVRKPLSLKDGLADALADKFGVTVVDRRDE